MKSNHEVSLLFDDKASSWNSKYAPNGPLTFRVNVFSELLAACVKPGAVILDFGGGTGAISGALARQGFQMTVCDVSEQMIKAGKQLQSDKSIEWCLLADDWKRLPFADQTFDAIIASSVFEYLTDPDHVLSECRRVLRSSGKLLFSVPNPDHRSRQYESRLQPLAAFALKLPLVRAIPKVGNYLRYLHVSRARFSAAQWRERASRHGLRPVEIDLPQAQPGGHQAMLYLAFARPV